MLEKNSWLLTFLKIIMETFVEQQKNSISNQNKCVKKEKMLETAPHVLKVHPGKFTKYSNLEDDLFSWIIKKRENGNAVTRKLITCKAISLSKNQEVLLNNPNIAGFKFSSKWLDRFWKDATLPNVV